VVLLLRVVAFILGLALILLSNLILWHLVTRAQEHPAVSKIVFWAALIGQASWLLHHFR
jgi:Co/Zn/Cd efflux system component